MKEAFVADFSIGNLFYKKYFEVGYGKECMIGIGDEKTRYFKYGVGKDTRVQIAIERNGGFVERKKFSGLKAFVFWNKKKREFMKRLDLVHKNTKKPKNIAEK